MLFGRKIDPVIVAMLSGALLVLGASYAAAADKGGPKKAVPQSDIPYMPPAATGWTGCGVSGHAGLVNADADFGAPINIGANGQTAGAGVYCDRAFDRFVIGAFADYNWVFGDLNTLGAENVWTAGGRAGILVTQSILAYGLVAFKRVELAGSGHQNGYAVGGGLETKLPGAPFFVALEYQKHTYSNVGGSTVDINADEVMLRLRYKFSMGK